MPYTKFYFAEFEIGGTLPVEDQYDPAESTDARKRRWLKQYLDMDRAVIPGEETQWHFGRLDDYQDYLFGSFGKTYTDEQRDYDEEIGDFVLVNEEATDADYSLFIVDFEQRVIAFSSTYRVRQNNFVTNFEAGWQNVISADSYIELELVENDTSLEQVLEEYPVYKIDAELRPTNPGPDPAFEDLDEEMQDMLVETFGITAERFNDSGINVENEFVEQVTSMSMSEYGERWEVQYGDDDVLRVISSSDSTPATTRLRGEFERVGELRDYTEDLFSSVRGLL